MNKQTDNATKNADIANATPTEVKFSGRVTFRAIKPADGEFYSEGHDIVCEGSAISISSEGAIVDTTDLMPEGSIVSVDLELKSGSIARNILGAIKRVDQVDGQMILGISFLKKSDLLDNLSGAELELLGEGFVDVKEAVERANLPTAPSADPSSKRVES